MGFQLISVDVFQTLVDVPSIKEKVWNIFLNDRYSAVVAQKVWDFIDRFWIAIKLTRKRYYILGIRYRISLIQRDWGLKHAG
jgi:hypothetical protein